LALLLVESTNGKMDEKREKQREGKGEGVFNTS